MLVAELGPSSKEMVHLLMATTKGKKAKKEDSLI
jgi:hypothetical protein